MHVIETIIKTGEQTFVDPFMADLTVDRAEKVYGHHIRRTWSHGWYTVAIYRGKNSRRPLLTYTTPIWEGMK
jgi:hypothetical protein